VSIVLTLAVLGTWAVLAVGLAALGAFFFNRLGGIEPNWRHAYCALWTGFALVIVSLMLWHFFLPVNSRALFTFTGLAALALIVERRWFGSVLGHPFSWGFAASCILFALWAANQGLAPGTMDDYIYEFQAIRWFHDYPIVPGLANLHGRIGFNNSHQLFAAMLSGGLWKGQANHIFNGFFVVAACVFLFDAVRDIARGTEGSLDRSLFPALLVCPCIGLVAFGSHGPMLSSLKADVFVAAATAVLACLFLRWATALPGSSESAVLAATTLLLAAVLPSVKLSAIMFSGCIVAVVGLRSLWHLTRESRSRRMMVGAFVVASVLAICFPIRGIILSGYPLYPSTALRVNVDWRVPAAQADGERVFVTSMGRGQPTYDPRKLSGWHWLREWARGTAKINRINIVLPLLLTLICLPMSFARPRGAPVISLNAATPGWAYATLACASIASLAMWFIQAPVGRFAIVQMWIVFAAVLAWGIQKQRGGWNWKAVLIGLALTLPLAVLVLLYYLRIPDESHARSRLLVLLGFAGLWVVSFGVLRIRNARLLAVLCVLPALFQYGEHAVGHLVDHQYRGLASMVWLHVSQLPLPESSEIVTRQTRSGLTIYETYTPSFETPLPNTEYFNSLLQLRTANMKDGFRVSSNADSAAMAQNGSDSALVPILENQAASYNARHQHAEAVTALLCALEISMRLGDRNSEANISYRLARLFEDENYNEGAKEKYFAAAEIFQALGDTKMAKLANESLQRVSQGQ
jgi:hypothetical protein